jgi:hypothetical protein
MVKTLKILKYLRRYALLRVVHTLVTGKIEMTPPVSPSNVLNNSSESEEDVGRRGSEDEADAECLYCAGFFSEDHDGEEWVRCRKCLKWAHTVCANYPKRAFVCDKCKK